jgi:lipoyl(octanoyl) transferase
MFDTWRLIKTPPASGAWNMAVDEAILQAVGNGHVMPTLRLYSWEPVCLSLGYAQSIGDVDIQQLKFRNWDIVRRLTGGRAILHTDELTYAVVGPQDDPHLTGGVLESYRRLSKALMAALLNLGLPVEALPQHQSPDINNRTQEPVCFEVPSNYEITSHGKKLVGSAQARKRDGVLQHGSLPLFGDLTRITQVLSFPSEHQRQIASDRLVQRATTIESVLQRIVSWEEAAESLIKAFKETLQLKFEVTELTSQEIENAEKLEKEKYAHPSWTERI